MKIRFFGDSWCWSWLENDRIKSSTLKKYDRRFPILEWVLDKSGISVITHNAPGACFRQTTKTIVESENNNEGIIYNVVFVSAPYRNVDINLCDVTNYDKFMYDWDSTIIKCLTQIQEWAHKNNQQVLLIGGHTTLSKELFDSLENSSNLHLLSECIVAELTGLQKTGKFRFYDFGYYIDTTYDKRLVDNIYEDAKQMTEIRASTIFWPDVCHLNPTAMLLVADKILYKIEQLEGEQK
jgi:hypothetical protein